jgi:hypothetical protein
MRLSSSSCDRPGCSSTLGRLFSSWRTIKLGSGVKVGEGTGVRVGGTGVAVGEIGVGVAVDGMSVGMGVGGTGVGVGGTGVAVGGSGIGVAAEGTGVDVAAGASDIGVAAGALHATKSNATNVMPIICCSSFLWLIFCSFPRSRRLRIVNCATSCPPKLRRADTCACASKIPDRG